MFDQVCTEDCSQKSGSYYFQLHTILKIHPDAANKKSLVTLRYDTSFVGQQTINHHHHRRISAT